MSRTKSEQEKSVYATSVSWPASVFSRLSIFFMPASSFSSRSTRAARSRSWRMIGSVGRRGLCESNADLLAVAPDHVGAEGLLLLRNVDVDHVRRADGIRADQAGAEGRDVADQAIGRVAAVVELDVAAQKALLPDCSASFHDFLPRLPDNVRDAQKIVHGVEGTIRRIPENQRDVGKQSGKHTAGAGPAVRHERSPRFSTPAGCSGSTRHPPRSA